MSLPSINPETKTGRVYELAFDILKKHPNGVRWAELNKLIEDADPSLHPKTINGCVWKMVEKYPDHVYKPEKGVFKLK